MAFFTPLQANGYQFYVIIIKRGIAIIGTQENRTALCSLPHRCRAKGSAARSSIHTSKELTTAFEVPEKNKDSSKILVCPARYVRIRKSRHT